MVREGEKPRRVDAVCWRVEVVNGARGERLASVSSIETTSHDSLLPMATILSADFCSLGSMEQTRERSAFFGVFVLAVIVKYRSGLKAFISLSRSTMIRRAGDWTRPADRP